MRNCQIVRKFKWRKIDSRMFKKEADLTVCIRSIYLTPSLFGWNIFGVKHKLINQSIIEINTWLPSGIHFQSLQNSNSLVLLSSRRQWYWSGSPQDSRSCWLDGLASSRHVVFTTSLWDFTCWRTSVNRTKNRKITNNFWNRNTLHSNVK